MAADEIHGLVRFGLTVLFLIVSIGILHMLITAYLADYGLPWRRVTVNGRAALDLRVTLYFAAFAALALLAVSTTAGRMMNTGGVVPVEVSQQAIFSTVLVVIIDVGLVDLWRVSRRERRSYRTRVPVPKPPATEQDEP